MSRLTCQLATGVMATGVMATGVMTCVFLNIMVRSIYVPDGVAITAWSVANARAQFSKSYSVADDKIILWQHIGHKRLPTTNFWNTNAMSARPITGDHIHMAMSIWVNGVPRQAEHDRPYEEDIPYEKKEDICRTPGNIAYSKLWPHSGVHTHCDGIIHVHPWSAPTVLRQEGRHCTLGMWFDQVGIEYRREGLAFKVGGRHDNNDTHRWRLAEYPCFNQAGYNMYTEQFDRIWLGHAYASYILWYGRSDKPPPPIAEHIATLQRWGAHGFDGQPYPQGCI